MMKIAPARESAFRILQDIQIRHSHSHIALHGELENVRMSKLDVALVSEIVHGVLTWQRLLDHWIRQLTNVKLQSEVIHILRMSLFQLRFLDRVPAYAVLSDAVELAKKYAPRAHGFVNAVLRGAGRQETYDKPLSAPHFSGLSRRELALRLSYPEWLDRHLVAALGERDATQAMWALNQKEPRTLRVNTLRCTRETLLEMLHQAGVQAVPSPVSPFGIRLAEGVNPLSLRVYQEGLCTLQGESSMLIAPLLEVLPGSRVLDACAAPGGKSTHMAELSSDLADITAVDVHAPRVQTIVEQTQRLQLHSVHPMVGDARRLSGEFDAVLLDAPCSGLGAIRRKADLKWSMSNEKIRELTRTQSELLAAVAKRVAQGGVLVYSTCTLSPAENEEQVAAFLQTHEEFALAEFSLPYRSEPVRSGMARILPQDFGGDGFFVAKMHKK